MTCTMLPPDAYLCSLVGGIAGDGGQIAAMLSIMHQKMLGTWQVCECSLNDDCSTEVQHGQ